MFMKAKLEKKNSLQSGSLSQGGYIKKALLCRPIIFFPSKAQLRYGYILWAYVVILFIICKEKQVNFRAVTMMLQPLTCTLFGCS